MGSPHQDIPQVLSQNWQELGSTYDPHRRADAKSVVSIVRITGGNFRLVERLMTQVARIVTINNNLNTCAGRGPRNRRLSLVELPGRFYSHLVATSIRIIWPEDSPPTHRCRSGLSRSLSDPNRRSIRVLDSVNTDGHMIRTVTDPASAATRGTAYIALVGGGDPAVTNFCPRS